MLASVESIGAAAAIALRRIAADPGLIKEKYKDWAIQSISDIIGIQRNLLELATALEGRIERDDEWEPDEDQTTVGEQTDGDGLSQLTDLDSYLEERREL